MLNSNSENMATVVETFFVEETLSLVHDATDLQKWNDLVSFLDLSGQKTIVKEDKSPIPFLWMNETLIATFKVLCPTETDITKYNKMPIPLEILDLVALSKREEYFDYIEIWYDEKTKDPVCIGQKTKEEYKDRDEWYRKYHTEKYLIGKWSDVKASFNELLERAKNRFINEKSLELKQTIKNATRQLEDIQEEAARKFGFGTSKAYPDLPF